MLMILMALKVSAAPTGDGEASTGDDTPSIDASWCTEQNEHDGYKNSCV